MEFQIEKSEFIRGLRLASSVADRKSTMPILSNVLLKANKENKLAVVATNLVASVAVEIDAKVDSEGSITVGAKDLYEIVNGLPGNEVKFKLAENNFAVISSKKSSYKLVGLPASDYPKIPDWQGLEFGKVDPKIMNSMIDKVIPSICTDESRFHLNGCLYESDGKTTTMVSTDGHRLAKVVQSTLGGPKLKNAIIIPKKGLSEVKHVLESANGPVDVGFDHHLFIKAGNVVLSVTPIDAQFPPYEQVIPQGHPYHVTFNRKELFEAFKRANVMATKLGAIKIYFEKTSVQITGDNPERGEGVESLDAEYNGPNVMIGLSAKYIMEFLAEMTSESVTFDIAAEIDPLIIKPTGDDGYLCIIMPMRLD